MTYRDIILAINMFLEEHNCRIRYMHSGAAFSILEQHASDVIDIRHPNAGYLGKVIYYPDRLYVIRPAWINENKLVIEYANPQLLEKLHDYLLGNVVWLEQDDDGVALVQASLRWNSPRGDK